MARSVAGATIGPPCIFGDESFLRALHLRLEAAGVPLTVGETVELQGNFRAGDGYFAADHTSFWNAKIG